MSIRRSELLPVLRHTALVLALIAGLALLGLLLSDGDAQAPHRIRLFASIVYGIFAIVAGVLLYLAWTISQRAAYGWTSAMLLGVGLQGFPFVLTSFAAKADSVHPGTEQVIELPLALWMLLMVVLARRGVTLGLRPLAIGIAGGVCFALGRIWLSHVDSLPLSWMDGTDPIERILLGAITVVVAVNVLRTSYDPRFMATFLLGVVMTGLSSALSTEASYLQFRPTDGVALVLAAAMTVVALLMLDASIRALTHSFDEQQAQMEALASKALRAEKILDRDQELLHEIRSAVGGLTTASTLLSRRDELTDSQRSSLQRAVITELNRVDRTVTGARTTVQAFPLTSIVDPLIAFHRAGGQQISWQPGPFADVPVRHIPDSVAQVVGTLLHNADRHAHGRPVMVTGGVHGSRVHLQISHPGPAIHPSVRAQLFERGARSNASPGQGLGLAVARRLMRAHGGDLALTASSEELTAFELTCPVNDV